MFSDPRHSWNKRGNRALIQMLQDEGTALEPPQRFQWLGKVGARREAQSVFRNGVGMGRAIGNVQGYREALFWQPTGEWEDWEAVGTSPRGDQG